MDPQLQPGQNRVLAQLGVLTLIGCAMALTQWFNPSGMELGARMAFWIGGLIAAWLLFAVTGKFGQAVADLIGINKVWGYAIAIPPTTVIISWAVLWWIGGTQAMFGPGFARIWPPTLAIAIAIFLTFFILFGRRAAIARRRELSKAQGVDDPIGIAASELHDQLPQGFPPILALSAEDHYLRVHSTARSEMLLMPLAKAIKLMPESTGIRVHRSWWVGRSALQSHRREGRDIKLILANDLAVPVSRLKVAELRALGWLP